MTLLALLEDCFLPWGGEDDFLFKLKTTAQAETQTCDIE